MIDLQVSSRTIEKELRYQYVENFLTRNNIHFGRDMALKSDGNYELTGLYVYCQALIMDITEIRLREILKGFKVMIVGKKNQEKILIQLIDDNAL